MYKMEKIIPKGITVKEFEQQLTVKPGDLGMIKGRPKYSLVYKVQVQESVRKKLSF